MQKTLYHMLRYNCSNPNHQCFQLKGPLETLTDLVGFSFCSYHLCVPGYPWITAGICKRSLKFFLKKGRPNIRTLALITQKPSPPQEISQGTGF